VGGRAFEEPGRELRVVDDQGDPFHGRDAERGEAVVVGERRSQRPVGDREGGRRSPLDVRLDLDVGDRPSLGIDDPQVRDGAGGRSEQCRQHDRRDGVRKVEPETARGSRPAARRRHRRRHGGGEDEPRAVFGSRQGARHDRRVWRG